VALRLRMTQKESFGSTLKRGVDGFSNIVHTSSISMKHTIKHLPKSAVEITFEVPVVEMVPHLETATEQLGRELKVPGFRPGHIPRAEIEKRIPPMKIFEAALEAIVRHCYLSVIIEEKVETIGSPAIDIKKMAPGNDLTFTATVSILPRVTRLTDYHTIVVPKKTVEVTDADIELVLKDLQKMQTREVRVTRPIEGSDRVVIDMTIARDKVPVEGGSTKNHVIIMDETYYVPGLTDALRGLKEGDEKDFVLNFPDTHYQKMLAGKPADFHVKVNEVYERSYPPVDDAFAKHLGKQTVAELRTLLSENILREKTNKENAREEGELLEKIVAGSQFEDVPELLIQEEVGRMRHELERGVAEQGLEWQEYLGNIKKTENDLKLDFIPHAITRVKTMLAIRLVALKENIAVSDKEIDEELDHIAELYKDDPETKKMVYEPEHRDQVAAMLKNRKTLARLREITMT